MSRNSATLYLSSAFHTSIPRLTKRFFNTPRTIFEPPSPSCCLNDVCIRNSSWTGASSVFPWRSKRWANTMRSVNAQRAKPAPTPRSSVQIPDLVPVSRSRVSHTRPAHTKFDQKPRCPTPCSSAYSVVPDCSGTEATKSLRPLLVRNTVG